MARGLRPNTHRRTSMASNQFRVLSGMHQEAVFTLADGDLLVIGSDEACDICLVDADVAPRHATLIAQGDAVSVRRLDGAVLVDGTTIAAALAPLRAGAEITLGESGVKLQLAVPADVAARASPTPDAKASRSTRQRSRAIIGAALAVMALGFVLNSVIDGRSSSGVASAAASKPKATAPISKAELLDQVREIFRTHGYQVELNAISDRAIRIENLDGGHERVRQVVARVRSDVPQLTTLTFAEPGTAQPPENLPTYESATGDRLSARVDGETAYLAAGTGARYFAGSVLPAGHTVRRITARGVQVERDGEISWFRF
jgi:hypothetical protein